MGAEVKDRNDTLGRLAVCKAGRLGIIEGHSIQTVFVNQKIVTYKGTGVDGRPWLSRAPRFITEEDSDIIIDALEGI